MLFWCITLKIAILLGNPLPLLGRQSPGGNPDADVVRVLREMQADVGQELARDAATYAEQRKW